jgi:hypothetical protein
LPVLFLPRTEGAPEDHQTPVVVAEDTLAAAAVVAVVVVDILVAVVAADIWVEVEVAAARVVAWAVTPRQPAREALRWRATALLWRITAPRVPTPRMPTTRFPANMPWANMRHPGLPAQSITTITPFGASRRTAMQSPKLDFAAGTRSTSGWTASAPPSPEPDQSALRVS